MELLILFAIVALLLLGPRRGGRMPGPVAILIAVVILIWMAMTFGLGWLWNAIFGTVPQR